MRFLKSLLILIIAILAISSCKTNEYSFLQEYSSKSLPIIDSTNFNNHAQGKLLTKPQQRKLGLNTLFGEKLDRKTTRVGISYLPKISDSYTSVVYFFYIDNTELTSMLVNYNSNYEIINSQMVAYDEIADNVLETVGIIYKDKIVLKEYISDNPSEIRFDILKNGDIVRE